MPHYLAQYGGTAFVGDFLAADLLARGDRVVVQTPRGVELATVLCEPAGTFAGLVAADAGGTILRPAAADDEREARRLAHLAGTVLAAAEAAVGAAPVQFLDVEALLDGRTVILQAVVWAATDLTPLLEDLSLRFGVAVRLHDLTKPPEVEQAGGCGSGGCGTGGCGDCSTGGGCGTKTCSSGAVKSAGEMAAYFAGLRTQMEAAARRTPLG